MVRELDAERWNRMAATFSEAIETPRERRAALLDHACGDDREMREEIEAMLVAHAAGEGLLLERWALAHGAGWPEAGVEMGAGVRIGPYRIAALVGRGGMGEVYRAERVEGGYHQTVAIKVLRPGLQTAEMLRRFRVERQVLARLQHPEIATILDGGALEDGRPFLVLQFVDGVAITEHCATRALSIEARLRLFLRVARAVQFAHGQLVIHRDIKPSNILVQEDGSLRLVDFGIAKLLDPNLSESLAVDTRPEVRLLTPVHAAPEQLRGEPVGTATDVYGLGVLLFELLTGRPPVTAAQRSPRELEQAILEQPAPAPSTVAPESARRALKGDLDRIVLMALRKEPARRYESAGQFADDVEHYLAGLPVRAQADTLRYRAGKFIARNRGWVTAAAGLGALLMGFAVVSGIQAGRIARERDRAERERAAAEDVVHILTQLFERANPRKYPGGDTVRVTALLDDAEVAVDRLGDQPERQATLLRAVGNMHAARGSYERAERLLRRSGELQWAVRGPDDVEAARTYHELARVVGRYEGAQAAHPMFDTSLARLRRLLGNINEDVRAATQDLALTAPDQASARALLAQVVDIERRMPGIDSIAIADRMDAEGAERFGRHRFAEAAALFEASLAILTARRGPNDPDRLTEMNNLALALAGIGELGRAESLLRAPLAVTERSEAGPDARGGARERLALVLANEGRLDEAESLEREALRLLRAGLAPGNGLIDNALRNLGIIVAARGRVVEGLALLDSAIAQARARNPRSAVYPTGQRVSLLLQLGRVVEAWRAATYADSAVRTIYPEGDWRLGEADRWVGLAAFARGDYRLAAMRFSDALEARRRERPDTASGPAQMSCALGSALEALGRREEALRLLQQACSIHDASGLPDPLITAWGRRARRRAERGRG